MAMVASASVGRSYATSNRIDCIATTKQDETSCRFVWSNAAFREFNAGGASSSSNFSCESTPNSGSGFHASGAIFWSNAAYRWEVNSASSSSSSGSSSGVKPLMRRFEDAAGSDFVHRDGIPGCSVFGTPKECTAESVGSCWELNSAVGSTRKRLIELPEFRQETKIVEVVDASEGWVHGPQRNMEQELASTMAVDRLQEETEQRLEEELEREIQALSRKLAARRPNNNANKAANSTTKQQAKNSKKSSKSQVVDEQLQDFKKLASSLWNKRPDWVKSLRRVEAVKAAQPKTHTVLKEKNTVSGPVRRQASSKAKENQAKARR